MNENNYSVNAQRSACVKWCYFSTHKKTFPCSACLTLKTMQPNLTTVVYLLFTHDDLQANQPTNKCCLFCFYIQNNHKSTKLREKYAQKLREQHLNVNALTNFFILIEQKYFGYFFDYFLQSMSANPYLFVLSFHQLSGLLFFTIYCACATCTESRNFRCNHNRFTGWGSLSSKSHIQVCQRGCGRVELRCG